jgi:hypothetical protein
VVNQRRPDDGEARCWRRRAGACLHERAAERRRQALDGTSSMIFGPAGAGRFDWLFARGRVATCSTSARQRCARSPARTDRRRRQRPSRPLRLESSGSAASRSRGIPASLMGQRALVSQPPATLGAIPAPRVCYSPCYSVRDFSIKSRTYMVEAAGIEPASERNRRSAATRLVRDLYSPAATADTLRRRVPHLFLTSTTARGTSTPASLNSLDSCRRDCLQGQRR